MPWLSKRREPAILALLLLLTILLYWPVRHAHFVYDDWWYIVHNPSLQTWDIRAFFAQPVTSATPESGLAEDVYRPLGTLWNAIVAHVWGLNPLAFHLLSLLVHLVNGLLLAGILERLLRDRRAALFGTGVFVWHAVQVQSVAWASQISGLVGMAGVFIALTCFLRGRKSTDRNVDAFRLALGWTAFAIAAFCKESTIVLPLVLILFWNRGRSDRRLFTSGIVAIAIGYLVCRQTALHHFSQFASGGMPWFESVALGALAFPVYIGKILFPVALRVSYAYPAFLDGGRLAAILLLPVYLGVALYLWRRAKLVAQGMLWILIGLLPVLGIVPIRAFVAERFLYFPMAGVALLCGWGWQRVGSWRSGLALWAVFLALQAGAALPPWHDERTLWANAVAQEPQDAFAHACYAQSLGETRAAEVEYFHTLTSHPTPGIRFAAYKNLAWLEHAWGNKWKANYWRRLAETLR